MSQEYVEIMRRWNDAYNRRDDGIESAYARFQIPPDGLEPVGLPDQDG